MKRVHFITLSRSDYASTKPVIQAALSDPDIEVCVTVGGSHLLERFGRTVEAIREDGIPIDYIAEFMSESDDSDAAIAEAFCRATSGFLDIFRKSQPDVVFIVGDRWEMQAVATVASMMRIPLAHHSGGDITEGSADNQTRYLITTLSHQHFTALPEHARRLVAMGEEEWRVASVGEPALTQLENQVASASEFFDFIGFDKGTPFVLATFHPTTYDPVSFEGQADLFIEGLEAIDLKLLVTAPNPDPGSDSFYRKLETFVSRSNGKALLYESLGVRNYYAAMRYAEFMFGNSSSGLWEAPSFGLPVVNIGSRQDGRVRTANVVDADLDGQAIRQALLQVRNESFKKEAKRARNPYVNSNTIALILDGLKTSRTRGELLSKKFVDPLNNAGKGC